MTVCTAPCQCGSDMDPKRRQLLFATSAAAAAQGMSPDWNGGFFCPCHGSQFGLAGRVLKSMPAPTNLEIPPHRYLAAARLLIGEDKSTN